MFIKKITVAAAFLLTIGVVAYISPPEAQGQQVQQADFAQGTHRSPLENHRVLLLGDSQTAGPFGRSMAWHLTSKGVGRYVAAGRQGWGVINWWQSRMQIARLLRQQEPTLLLIELGGNDWNRANRSREYKEMVQQFWDYLIQEMNLIHSTAAVDWRIIWISPATVTGPRTNELQPGRDRAAQIIRSVTGERNYISSSNITSNFGRTPDGLHFTHSGASDWARKLIPRIESRLQR